LSRTKEPLLRALESSNDIDGNWNRIKEWIACALEESCGTLRYCSKPNKVFWTEELRTKKRRILNQLENFNELVQTGQQGPVTTAARLAMRNAQVEYRALLLKRRSEVFQGIVNNLNKKQNAACLMKYVKNCKARRNRKGCALEPEKMEEHARHFQNTFGGRPMARELTGAVMAGNYAPKIISELEIHQEIQNISMGKAAGVDGIMAECYVYGKEHMTQVLKILFQKISNQCRIPDEWKASNVCLVYKEKGSNKDVGNYRPISLTITARRLYERIIKRELIDAERMLANTQGGFRSKRSTLQQVYAWSEINLDTNNINVLLDLKAAYDLVDRRILWDRLLTKFNVPYSTVQRLKNLFDENRAYLVIGGRKSDPIECRRGLLQGSSLSPTLFNLFIDELLQELKNNGATFAKAGRRNNHLAFADDIILMGKTTQSMQQLIQICELWSLKVGMRFSPSKCVVLNETAADLKIYGESLKKSNTEKYLGIPISQNGVEFGRLAKERTDKAKGVIRVMGNLGMNINGFSPEASSRLYKSFIRPVMEYGLQLKTLSKDEINLYQKTQNMALRQILSVPRNTSIEAMHKLLLIETMEVRNRILNLQFVGKLHNSTDKYVPAVRIWRSQLQDLPKKSLTEQSRKNPLWTEGKWRNLLFTPLGANVPEICVLDEKKKKELVRKSIMDLAKNETNVAGVLELNDTEKHRFVLKSSTQITRPRRITIVRWLVGAVAMHQLCRSCDLGVELNREHAVMCSGAGAFLSQIYTAIPQISRYNKIDYLLNTYRQSSEETAYENIEQAIGMVYRNCLHYEQSENGFWISRHRDNAPTGVG
jgi:hypothetical protein